MAASIEKYLDRITGAFRSQPLFIGGLSAILQPIAELRDLALSLPQLFDLDTAVGQQLDFVGQWIGQTRFVDLPLTNQYFSFDISGQGFDQAVWFGPGSATSGVFELADEPYRLLLKARALNNAWDGSIPQAYALYDVLFAGSPNGILIHDDANLTMRLELTGPPVAPVTAALFTGGYLDIRPAGILVSAYILP